LLVAITVNKSYCPSLIYLIYNIYNIYIIYNINK